MKSNVFRVAALVSCVLDGSLSELLPWLPSCQLRQCANEGQGPLLKLAARKSIRVQPERPSSGRALWAVGRLAE